MQKNPLAHERLLTLPEIEQLRAWAVKTIQQGNLDGALVLTLLGTAARRAEVAAFTNGSIRQGIAGPEAHFPKVKGGGTATVPISEETWRLLSGWTWQRPASWPLLPAKGCKHMNATTVWRHFRSALQAAGIDRELGVHATRHAAGFLLLRATGDLTKVQVFLRHSNLSTTSTWYQHVHLPDLRAGLEKAGL